MDAKPRLFTPAIVDVIGSVREDLTVDVAARHAMHQAMRDAAERRLEGILGNRRRRHYGHAAMLAACCLALAPVVGRQKALSDWIAMLRKKYSRLHAFREELERAVVAFNSL